MRRSGLAAVSVFAASALFAVFCVLASAATATAQSPAPPYEAMKPLGSAAPTLPSFLKKAGISQNLNRELPLGDHFRDATGADHTLGTYFESRPVVMALVYYKCRLLCPQVLSGMATALRQTGFKAGKQYDVVVASIDPSDTPADAVTEKQRFLGELGDSSAAAHVHFLTTSNEAAITDLATATGFHYVMIPGPDGKMDQYAHSTVIMIATSDGRMSKYLSGIEYPARDVRMALVEASNHHIGSFSDLVLIYCCNYSPASGKYTVAILRVLGLAAMASIFMLAVTIVLLTRKPKGTPTQA